MKINKPIYWIAAVVVIVLIASLIAVKVNVKQDTNQDAQEKCEESGGLWSAMCNSAGCEAKHCFCDMGTTCLSPNFDYFKQSDVVGLVQTDRLNCSQKILSNNVCVACKKNADCGPLMPSQGRTYCFEYEHICVNGMCSMERRIYSNYIINNQHCVPK